VAPVLDITGVVRVIPDRLLNSDERRWLVAISDGRLSTSIEVYLPRAARVQLPDDEAAWVRDALRALLRDREVGEDEQVRALAASSPIEFNPTRQPSLGQARSG
jgi:hypothetical protein